MEPFVQEYFWVLFGLVWLGVGCYKGYKFDYLRRKGVRTEGIIDSHLPSTTGDTEHPVIKFKTLEGSQMITKKLDFATKPRIYYLGQSVKVIYDPENPKRASIDSKILHIWIPIALMVVGTGFIIYGIIEM